MGEIDIAFCNSNSLRRAVGSPNLMVEVANLVVGLLTFGTFYRHNQPQKTARNISKNYAITLPPCFTPKFKPATTWREHLKKISK